MKSVFNKTLIAAAIASVATAQAATISSTDNEPATGIQQVISSEGLAILGGIDVVEPNAAGFDADADLVVAIDPDVQSYTDTDTMIFTFSGATVDTTASVTSGIELVDASGNQIATFFNIGSSFVSLSPDTTTNTAALTTLNTAGNGLFYLTGVTLDVTGDVSVSYNASRAGEAFDAGSATEIAQLDSEYTISSNTSDLLNATIDVEEERKEFTTSPTTTTDTYSVSVVSDADLLQTTRGNATIMLKAGDLDFLADEDGDLDSGQYAVTGTEVSASADLDLTSSPEVLTVETNDNVGDVTLTLYELGNTTANADRDPMSAQSFTADVEVDYVYSGTAGSISVEGLSAGSWGLSGATVNIPYMPYGSGISQIIYVSNSSDVAGDIELTAFDDQGNSFGPVTLSITAAGDSVTNIGPAVGAALEDAGFDGTGKVDMTLVVNSPSGDIDVFAAYNVRGDRLATTVQ